MGWVRVERADTTNLVCRLHAMLRRLRLPSIAAPQPHCWPQRALNTAILAMICRWAGKDGQARTVKTGGTAEMHVFRMRHHDVGHGASPQVPHPIRQQHCWNTHAMLAVEPFAFVEIQRAKVLRVRIAASCWTELPLRAEPLRWPGPCGVGLAHIVRLVARPEPVQYAPGARLDRQFRPGAG